MILAIAMVLDAALGEPRWLWSRMPHPAVLMGRLVRSLEQRLNRGSRRRLRGVLASIAMLIVAIGAGMAITAIPGHLADIVVIAILLAQRSLVDHVTAVANALEQGLPQARKSIAMIVSRDCSAMDEAAISRSAIESAAENQSDGVIAPLFWALVAGVPGIVAYKMINTADSMIGYRTDRYREFGWAAARLDDVVNLIPARLTGMMLVTRRAMDWRGIVADARRHASPNAGWPEAVMARSLGVALAGPRSYHGTMRPLAWVNETGSKYANRNDIRAANRALWRCWVIALALVLVFT